MQEQDRQNQDRVRFGFLLAGGMNFSVVIFSLATTNTYLTELYPGVFARLGLVSIVLWGAAYIAVADHYRTVRGLVGVFAVEKLVYVVTWVYWMKDHAGQLGDIFDQSVLTCVFYSIYGPNDLAFFCFFTWVWWKFR